MDGKRIGLIVALEDLILSDGTFMESFDLNICEIKCWHPENYTSDNLLHLKEWVDEGLFRISGLWCGWSGPVKWDLYEGPHVLGLVPSAYRANRVLELKKGIQFAHDLGVKQVTTHVGFIPENPLTTEYQETVSAVRELVTFCLSLDITFNFETGQETPVTLMRFIEDIGLPNQGINLDPANLLLYGRGNPIDAVSVYGDKIKGVHIKDGFYPGTGETLGKEVSPGSGMVNFPLFLEALNRIDYQGDYIIEREPVSGNARQEISKTVKFLVSIFNDY